MNSTLLKFGPDSYNLSKGDVEDFAAPVLEVLALDDIVREQRISEFVDLVDSFVR